MSIYSPSQERFTIPEDIGTEAQTSTSLSSSAVSEVQGAKADYISESEFPVSPSSSEPSTFYSPSISRSCSFSQPPMTHSPLVSPSTYPAFNSQAFPTRSADGVMASMYPNGACMSPSAYMSPYGMGKQYTWPTTPNAYSTYYPTQTTIMLRPGYPTAYFPPQVTAATHA